MRKILIIGQAPSRSHAKGRRALDGPRSGDRLAQLAGLSRDELFARADAVNLLHRWYGKAGKGDAFPLEPARAQARAMLETFSRKSYAGVIFLGQNVAHAFGLRKAPLCEWIHCPYTRGLKVAVLPHPSGINLWYNSARNVAIAKSFMRRTLGVEP